MPCAATTWKFYLACSLEGERNLPVCKPSSRSIFPPFATVWCVHVCTMELGGGGGLTSLLLQACFFRMCISKLLLLHWKLSCKINFLHFCFKANIQSFHGWYLLPFVLQEGKMWATLFSSCRKDTVWSWVIMAHLQARRNADPSGSG